MDNFALTSTVNYDHSLMSHNPANSSFDSIEKPLSIK